MKDDKKAIAAMIVAKAKKPTEDDSNPFPSLEEEGGSEEDEMGLDTAVSDMMAAFQSQDTALLKEALKSFITQYS